jgi:hypothetical protein
VCFTCKKDCWACVFNETINCERYIQIILGQLFSELTEEEILYDWFQQDSATVHTARIPIYSGFVQYLGERIISSDIWPARSPDLNPYDFFFWGCLKNKVYSSNPRKEELKENIHREISNIPAEHLQKVKQNLFRRCEECLRIEGQHFNASCNL